MHAKLQDVYELLVKGQFICSNAVDNDTRNLYTIIDDNFSQFADYFEPIGYRLERGDEYFYFSRREARVDVATKLQQLYKWIDILDFFKTYDSSFGVGSRFSPSDILVKLKVDASLKDKLDQLKKPLGDGNHAERIDRLIKEMVRLGIAALEHELTRQYKILSAYHYIEQLLMRISINEDTNHEIPE